MTDSNLPPESAERAAQRLRSMRSRLAGKSDPRPRVGAKAYTSIAERPANGTRAGAVVRQRSPNIPATARIAAAQSSSGATSIKRISAPSARLLPASARSNDSAPSIPSTAGTASAPQRVAGRAAVVSKRSANVDESDRPRAKLAPSAVDDAPLLARRRDSAGFSPRSPRRALEPDKVSVPTRRSKRVRHPLVIIGNAVLSIFVILMIAAGYVVYVGAQRFDAPGPLPQDSVVDIPRGSGMRDIANVLMREGVIDQPWVFVGGVIALKARGGLKAGEYQFKAHASLHEVVTTILDGRVVIHQISVPEGLTSQQIVARLMDDDVLTGNIDEIPAEGTMLPDTYNFSRGMTRAQLILRMQQAQQRLVRDVWARRAADLPLKRPEQLVVLASLIEKETGKPEERTRIAAVFVNRLKQRMRLQSDPTIIYGLVGGKGTLGRSLTKNDVEETTPYNTYQIDGLPPGPITNPGRASLEAAANPARTRDLYFVADGTGGHAFAETYEQHQKNVQKFRQIEASQKDQDGSDDDTTQPPANPPHHTRHRAHR